MEKKGKSGVLLVGCKIYPRCHFTRVGSLSLSLFLWFWFTNEENKIAKIGKKKNKTGQKCRSLKIRRSSSSGRRFLCRKLLLPVLRRRLPYPVTIPPPLLIMTSILLLRASRRKAISMAMLKIWRPIRSGFASNRFLFCFFRYPFLVWYWFCWFCWLDMFFCSEKFRFLSCLVYPLFVLDLCRVKWSLSMIFLFCYQDFGFWCFRNLGQDYWVCAIW